MKHPKVLNTVVQLAINIQKKKKKKKERKEKNG